MTDGSRPNRRVGSALLETAALYGLLTWVYVAIIAVTDLGSLNDRMVHWAPLRIDTAGAIALLISMCCFAILCFQEKESWPRRTR